MTIQQVLKDLRIEFLEAGGHHHTRPGWVQLDCPFCGPDSKHFHLGFNLESRYFHCWKCSGHHTGSVLARLGASAAVVKEFLQDRGNYVPPHARKREGLKEPSGRGPLHKAHRQYLRSRGFVPADVERLWQIEGIALHARLSWRIYVPIIAQGVRLSWTTRAIGDQVAQRYLSAGANEEAENHKHLVYGLDFCYASVVIVEGPFDAWAIGPGAGALFGTAFSTPQVRRLAQVPCRYVVFDNTAEAQARAKALCLQLACFPGTTQQIQLDAKDPGSASEREIKLLRRATKLSL